MGTIARRTIALAAQRQHRVVKRLGALEVVGAYRHAGQDAGRVIRRVGHDSSCYEWREKRSELPGRWQACDDAAPQSDAQKSDNCQVTVNLLTWQPTAPS